MSELLWRGKNYNNCYPILEHEVVAPGKFDLMKSSFFKISRKSTFVKLTLCEKCGCGVGKNHVYGKWDVWIDLIYVLLEILVSLYSMENIVSSRDLIILKIGFWKISGDLTIKIVCILFLVILQNDLNFCVFYSF